MYVEVDERQHGSYSSPGSRELREVGRKEELQEYWTT